MYHNHIISFFQWLYLYKIFSDVEQAVYDADLTVKYDIVNRKFQV